MESPRTSLCPSRSSQGGERFLHEHSARPGAKHSKEECGGAPDQELEMVPTWEEVQPQMAPRRYMTLRGKARDQDLLRWRSASLAAPPPRALLTIPSSHHRPSDKQLLYD